MLTRLKAQRKYIQFINEGKHVPSLWEGDGLKSQIFLGNIEFVEQHQEALGGDYDLPEVPRLQRQSTDRPLTYFKKEYLDKKEGMVHAFLTEHYTIKEIGKVFGVHYSTVSRAVRLAENRKAR